MKIRDKYECGWKLNGELITNYKWGKQISEQNKENEMEYLS